MLLNEPLLGDGESKTAVPEPTPEQLEREGADFMAAMTTLGKR